MSTKSQCSAPQESASKPMEPVPQNKSRHLDPGRYESNQLKRVSRTIPLVGRKSFFISKGIFRPRHRPLIILNFRSERLGGLLFFMYLTLVEMLGCILYTPSLSLSGLFRNPLDLLRLRSNSCGKYARYCKHKKLYV